VTRCPAVPEAVDALFQVDGDFVVPTILTQGPWDPGAQHGGPVCAVLTWAAERVPTLVPMRFARLTFDLVRPAPLVALRVEAHVRREGKRIQLVEGVLLHERVEVARLTALRVRVGDSDDPSVTADPRRPDDGAPRPPTEGRGWSPGEQDGGVPGFLRALELDRVAGEHGMGAPATTWFRLTVPVVAGHDTTPAMRLAAIADFTSATATYLDPTEWSPVNPDVTVHVLREPVGEWIAVDAVAWYATDGIGHSRASLYDLTGLVGTGATSSILDRRPAPFSRRGPIRPG
jgi:hypothetical protein